MFFGKRKRRKDEEELRPPAPDELDDDFGFELESDDPSAAGTPAPPAPPPARRDDATAPPGRPKSNRPLRAPDSTGGGGRDLHEMTVVDPPSSSSVTPPAPGPPPTADPGVGDDMTVFQGRPVAPTVRTVAWLVAATGANRGRDYRLGDRGLRVGTAPDCDLRITGDEYVSSRHAELTESGGVFILRDLGSTNGTFRNDTRISETPVEDDDRISFGKSVFVFKVARL
jgi:hypothetical protein